VSYSASDYNGDDGTVICPTCDSAHPPASQLIRCGHEGCEAKLCGMCAKVCRCGDKCGPRCEDHLFLSTLNGALSRPIEVCKNCKDDDYDEVLAGSAVPVCTDCLQRCLTINEVTNPDGHCLGCREESKRKVA